MKWFWKFCLLYTGSFQFRAINGQCWSISMCLTVWPQCCLPIILRNNLWVSPWFDNSFSLNFVSYCLALSCWKYPYGRKHWELRVKSTQTHTRQSEDGPCDHSSVYLPKVQNSLYVTPKCISAFLCMFKCCSKQLNSWE